MFVYTYKQDMKFGKNSYLVYIQVQLQKLNTQKIYTLNFLRYIKWWTLNDYENKLT